VPESFVVTEHYYYVFCKDENYKGSTQECKKKKKDLTKASWKTKCVHFLNVHGMPRYIEVYTKSIIEDFHSLP